MSQDRQNAQMAFDKNIGTAGGKWNEICLE